MNWQTVRLGDIADFLSGGTPSMKKLEYWGGNIPWVSAKDLKGSRINDSILHLTEEGALNGTKLVPENTILCVVRGMSLANEFRISLSNVPTTFNQDLKAICPYKGVDPIFLFYTIFARRDHIKQLAGEASHGTKKLPTEVLQSVEIKLPDLSVQQQIASVASSYDDLIENNRRRIKLLEQSASLLYKEWFVRLRFPGHEHVKIKDGVPEGWQVVPLGDVAKINNESLGKNYQGEIEYIDISSVTPGMINETTYYKFSDSPSRARRIVRHGDIIWSCVRPIRRSHAVIWNPPANLIASTGFAVLTPVSLSTAYLYQVVTTDEFVGYLSNNARGAAYPAVTSSDFESAQILLPKENILDQFKKMVEPLLEQIQSLHQQSIKLAKARDLLLPRLMNGEIEV